MVEEGHVVALHVVQGTAHAGEALAESQVIGGMGLRGLPTAPVPVTSILEVAHVKLMVADDIEAFLEPEVVDAAQSLLEDLGPHDRRADGEHDSALEVAERAGEELVVPLRRPPDRRAVED